MILTDDEMKELSRCYEGHVGGKIMHDGYAEFLRREEKSRIVVTQSGKHPVNILTEMGNNNREFFEGGLIKVFALPTNWGELKDIVCWLPYYKGIVLECDDKSLKSVWFWRLTEFLLRQGKTYYDSMKFTNGKLWLYGGDYLLGLYQSHMRRIEDNKPINRLKRLIGIKK